MKLEGISCGEVSGRRARLQPCRKDQVSNAALAAEVRFSECVAKDETLERRTSGAKALVCSG
jgi:hypothetical protein